MILHRFVWGMSKDTLQESKTQVFALNQDFNGKTEQWNNKQQIEDNIKKTSENNFPYYPFYNLHEKVKQVFSVDWIN